jgi:class 3 adenylate cyclase
MFTDIVGSTELAGRLGDRAWHELLGRHDRGVRNVLHRHRGREVKTTGDGFLAVFDGPGRAVRAAIDMKASSRAIGLEIRAGVHTGEIELAGDDVRGVAVHEAARIAAAASAGEILASSTTHQLATGAGLSPSRSAACGSSRVLRRPRALRRGRVNECTADSSESTWAQVMG